MLTPDMKRIIEEQRLGFVATAALDGTPNVSPKGTFIVLNDQTIAFGEIRSPGTMRNLRANPRIEVNFVDPFVRKGYRFAGTATVVERGDSTFEALLDHFHGPRASRMRAIVTISVMKALPPTRMTMGQRSRRSDGCGRLDSASSSQTSGSRSRSFGLVGPFSRHQPAAAQALIAGGGAMGSLMNIPPA